MLSAESPEEDLAENPGGVKCGFPSHARGTMHYKDQ